MNASDAKSPITLSERPGLLRKVRPSGNNGQVRAILRIGDILYSLVGSKFYSTNLTTLASTLIGTVSSTAGKAWIDYNANSQIMIAADNIGYVYNYSTSNFAQIADTDFPGASSMDFQDNYGVVIEPDSGRLWNSNLNDFTAWNPLDFVTAEAAPDNLLAVISDHQELICLGEETIEIYSNVGDVDAVFQRQQGGFLEIGINAPGSVQKITNVVLWLDDSLQVRMLESYAPNIISTPAISYQISQMGTTDDAIGMTHIWNGHAIYTLTFPSANRTLAYDITESRLAGAHIWHELTSYPLTSPNRWRGNVVHRKSGTVYVGDYSNGWIYVLDENTHTDNLQPMQRVWTTANVFDNSQRRLMFHDELEVEVEAGVGTDDIDDPQIVMQYSDDNGKTWSHELWESIGKVGEFENRARWFGLGESRNRIYRFTVTENVKLEVVGVYLGASMGIH